MITSDKPFSSSGLAWLARRAVLVAIAGVLGGCASSSHRAPVEERTPVVRLGDGATDGVVATSTVLGGATDAQTSKPPLPGAENAGKPGYYSVRQGDTLIRVGLDAGQNWRDIARWNGIDNPNLIEVGQVLRVAPPVVDASGAAIKPVLPAGRIETRPLDGKAPLAPAAQVAAAAAASAAAAVPPPIAREGDDDVNWMWPAAGPVATSFDDGKSKGLDITGKAGDPVVASADGRVVYAGAGLRGLGNLVIIKHNTTYLTAYAHNQTLLVKEDQVVRRGQKIAEMGSTDADRVQLHFEIRRQGKPIDPARLLPAR